MTHLYRKPLSIARWMFLVVLLIGSLSEAKAQQKSNPDKKVLKLPENHPLQKIGPELASLKTQFATGKTNARSLTLSQPVTNKSLLQVKGNYVVIEALAEGNTAQLVADLQALGMTHTASYGRSVSGLIPIEALDKAAALKSLHSARPAYKPITKIGQVTTQGDRAMYADSARKQQIVKGKGTKVGVISDSYDALNGAEKGVKTGDLPGKTNPNGFTAPVQVLLDEAPGYGTDEGRGMAEIIHDVAPGAQLAFHSANFGQASFAQGILDLQKAGCTIITDDIIYLAEPMFQDGIIAQAVDAVKKTGVSYFSAAGNQGKDSYQAAFKSGGEAYFGSNSEAGPQRAINAHNFAPAGEKKDVTQKVFVPVGATLILSFQYSQPFYSVGDGSSKGATSDLDLYILTEDTTDIVTASTYSNIGDDPVELLGFTNDGSYDSNYFNILIDNYDGKSPDIIKYVAFKDDNDISIEEYETASSTIYGHNNAAGAITTGAVFFIDTPAYGTARPVAESFSSAGGTPILFDANGKSKPQVIRKKPEIMAPDGGSTTFFGSPFLDEFYFFGTSAAAPHAAAVAALMQEANGNGLKADEVKNTLQQTALDMEEPGFDYETGNGLINAYKAVQSVFKPRVLHFSLVDADSRKTIKVLKEGDIINLTRLPNRHVFIYARTGPARVGSVAFDFNGDKVIENGAAYNYPGTSYNKFIKLTEGNYTIQATPYTRANAKGETGIPLTVSFKAIEEQIVRFELFDTEKGKVIKTLANNDVLNLAELPSQLNIRAVTNPVVVGSVKFNLNDKITTENINTYDLAGSSGGSIDFKPGTYSLTATIYPYEMGRGMAGGTKNMVFRVINSSDIVRGSETDQLLVYPNPFSQKTKIRFSLPATEYATLTIYDLNGTQVAVLHNGQAEAGKQYEYTLDGSSLPVGLYISRLVTGKTTLSQKLRLAK